MRDSLSISIAVCLCGFFRVDDRLTHAHTWGENNATINAQQERGAHMAASMYPSVLANMGGCFLMGLMYEGRVRAFLVFCP